MAEGGCDWGEGDGEAAGLVLCLRRETDRKPLDEGERKQYMKK